MNSKSFISIALSAVFMCIAVGIVYFIGGSVEESHWIKGMKLAEWQSVYLQVLAITGFVVFLMDLIWIVRSSTASTLDNDGYVDMGPTWWLITLFAIAASIAIPIIMIVMDVIPHLYFLNIIIGAFVFTLVYYVCSVIGSHDKFRYVPLGASLFRK